MTAFSIKSILDDYAATLERQWEHDRRDTVGASEIGQCIRKTWFSKWSTPWDDTYVDRYGAKLRGTLMENHFFAPAIQAAGAKLAGKDQRTITDGYLSATPDAVVPDLPRDCLNEKFSIPDIGASRCIAVEDKSLDPRVDLQEAKSENVFQVHTQLGLLRHQGIYKPDYAIICYINASFWDDVSEYVVKFNPTIYEAAKMRARRIMTSDDPMALTPEGKLSGSKECVYCPWASHCNHIQSTSVPRENKPLGDNAVAELRALRDKERSLSLQTDISEHELALARQNIKDFLRENEVRSYHGDGWSISWSSVSGRSTIDSKALEASGIDLTPYRKQGDPGERLTVK